MTNSCFYGECLQVTRNKSNFIVPAYMYEYKNNDLVKHLGYKLVIWDNDKAQWDLTDKEKQTEILVNQESLDKLLDEFT